MSITVFEALQLPIMKRANLVAGHGGINAPIKWVTIVEVIEDSTRLQAGEFLITTAYGLAEDQERQNIFIEELATQKISALAIQTGFYLHTIPTQFIEAANRFQLPLFELPADLNFSMVTKEILQQVVNRQFERMAYSEDIHRKLIDLVLANGGLASIAQLLANWTAGDVLVTNQNYELIAEACTCLTPAEKEHLLTMLQSKTHQECNYKNYVVSVTPVVADETILGYLLVLKKNNSLKDLDKLAVGQAAIVCALEFLKLAAVEQAEQHLQEDLLEELIHGEFSSKNAMIEKAKAFGLDLTAPQTIIKILLDNRENSELRERLITEITQTLHSEGKKFILKHRHNALLLLIEADPTSLTVDKTLLEKIAACWPQHTTNIPLQIGVGQTYRDISFLAESAAQAEKAVKYAPILLKHKGITYYQDLAPYYMFIDMLEQGTDPSKHYQVLNTLLAYDAKHNSELLYTLETFLYENMNIQQAAAKLFIHRHTLKYRLEKIADLTGMDVLNYHQRLQLNIALITYKLDRLETLQSI